MRLWSVSVPAVLDTVGWVAFFAVRSHQASHKYIRKIKGFHDFQGPFPVFSRLYLYVDVFSGLQSILHSQC